MISSFKVFYKKHEKHVPAAFFILGFLFDVVTLTRIDDVLTILQQFVYLVLLGVFLSWELMGLEQPLRFWRWFDKVWSYREIIIHFIFGSLLSSYTLFYFKSASLGSSALFLAVMSALLVVNELPRFQKSELKFKFALYSLCLSSYFAYLVPILLRSIGVAPFLIALTLASVILFFIKYRLSKKQLSSLTLYRFVTKPAVIVQVAFLIFYMFRIIPPVPLSLEFIGIYHDVQRTDGVYMLHHERPWWRVWHSGDQLFKARQGDRIFCFARVFSPTRFHDEIKIRWLYKDEKLGWQPSDAVPLQIVGGRKEGYRGFSFKQNYAPGKWRVQIETGDGREIGRINFEVVINNELGDRAFRIDQS